MKRCPKCNENYPDASLNFCMTDGSTLLLSHDPEETVVQRKPHDRETIQNSTNKVNPPSARSFLRSPHLYIVLVVILMVLLTIGVILYEQRGRELEQAQDQVEQLETEVISLKRKVSELEAKVASMRPASISGIDFVRVNDGYVWDDIYFVNDSDKDLEDVDVTVTLTDEDGHETSERNLTGVWRNGEEHYIRVTTGSYQKGTMRGLCNQGKISLSWVF